MSYSCQNFGSSLQIGFFQTYISQITNNQGKRQAKSQENRASGDGVSD